MRFPITQSIACAILLCSAATTRAARPDRPAVSIVLERGRKGWTADYTFRKSAPVWFFQRSKDSIDKVRWRLASFNVVTPGVGLSRLGNFDALYRRDGRALRHVRIRVTPFSRPLRSDYAPALTFSDGGLAFYTHHFVVSPVASVVAAEALPASPDWDAIADAPATLTVRDEGQRLLVRGRAVRDAATLSLAGPDTYVYVGTGPLVATDHFAEIIDPGLPVWVRGQLDVFLPRLMAYYTERLGIPSGSKPTALIAWEGAARSGSSIGGSVMDRLVVMAISGRTMLAADPKALAALRAFFGHETSHFWIGQTLRYSRPEEGWITEGSADVLGIRAVQHLVPGYDPQPGLQQEMDDCLKLNGAGKPLLSAESRGDYKAQYACGALLVLAAEAALRRENASADALTFVRQLLDANRADGVVSEAGWLATFSHVAGPAIADRVKVFIDDGVDDPRSFWAELFKATGVRFVPDRDTLRLLDRDGAVRDLHGN